MSSSVQIDNKGKDILILGGGPTQVLYYIPLTAEAIYPINFLQPNKRFVLILRYNECNSFLFVNAQIYQFKAKDSEIKDYSLCLGNISKGFTVNNMKKPGLKGVVKFFSIVFNPIDINNILDIHKYLTKKPWYKMLGVYCIINWHRKCI